MEKKIGMSCSGDTEMGMKRADRAMVDGAKTGMNIADEGIQGMSSSEADWARKVTAHQLAQLRKIALGEIKRQRRALKVEKFVYRFSILWAQIRKGFLLLKFKLQFLMLDLAERVLLKFGDPRIDAHTETPNAELTCERCVSTASHVERSVSARAYGSD